jgi:hypothetical protein
VAKPKLVWHGDEVLKKVQAAAIRNGNRALQFLTADCKRKLSRGNVRGTKPSAPGEYPKKVTGALMNSIDYEPMQVEGTKVRGRFGMREGPASAYGPALEFGYTDLVETPGRGTGYYYADLAARPFLRPTAINGREKVKELLGAGFGGGA